MPTTTMLRRSYIPPRDSLAALVCGYFQNNPTEELGLDDIVEKFSLKSHARVHTDLSDAWRAGLILRDTNSDGDVVYSAGNLEFTAKAASGGYQPKTITGKLKPPPKNPNGKTPRAKPAGPTIAFPNPLEVPLETGVPVESVRANAVDWALLLNRMKVDQSAKLPMRCKSMLSKTITELHKNTTVKFITKVYPDAQELRVWRVR